MSHFVRDNTALPYPKVAWDGASDEFAEPTQWIRADPDWNVLCQATVDLRQWVETGLPPGTYTNVTLIVDADGRIVGVATGAGGGVPTSRTLTGTSPVRIDGGASADLSANRTIALANGTFGDIVASSAWATLTIGAAVVTNAKLANMATARIKGRTTAGTGDPEDLTAAQTKTLLAIAAGDVSGLSAMATTTDAASLTGNLAAARMPALTGDVTSAVNTVATTIANDAVTYAKMQNVSATQRLLGRNTAGAGDVEEVTPSQVATMLGVPTAFAAFMVFAGSGVDATISPAGSSTTTVTKDMFWTTFTVPSGTCTVKTKGYRIHIQTLDLSSGGTVVFHHDGDAASGATGATGMNAEGSLKVTSGTGASGIGNAGQAGAAPTGGAWPTSFRGGLGGTGQAGGGGAGGAGGPAPSLTADTEGSVNDFIRWMSGQWFFATSTRVCGGSGGGSAAGSGTPVFAQGGGGGAGGGKCVVIIGQLVTPANAGNVTVRANGGAGGTGPISLTTGGGGGGGYAGVALLSGAAADLTAIVVQANGGAGNTGGGTLGPSGQIERFGPK